MEPGEVEAIWIKPGRRVPMDPVEEAEMVAGKGIRGNAEQGGWRQVTLLAREAWDRALEEVEGEVDPSARRANLLLRGVELRESKGRLLRVGECRLRIWGETTPCYRMDEALPGLQEALRPEWRGGAYAEVLDGGGVRVGDPARWVGYADDAGPGGGS